MDMWSERKSKEPLETKYYKLERLVKWEGVDKVNEMLMAGVPPRTVSDWCKQHGFDISHPKLYEYKEILQEAISKHITVERMLGVGTPKRSPVLLQAAGIAPVRSMVKSEMEVLDDIIQLGYNSLIGNNTVKFQDAMKAIELKNKLTGGTHGGLTNYGLDQLRALEQAKFQAVLEIVLAYLPEEKHNEVYEAMVKAEREYYETQAPEFLDEYEKSLEEEVGSYHDSDDTIVSNTRF